MVQIILSEESDVSDISDSDDDDDSDDEPLVKKQGPPTVCITPGLTLSLAIQGFSSNFGKRPLAKIGKK